MKNWVASLLFFTIGAFAQTFPPAKAVGLGRPNQPTSLSTRKLLGIPETLDSRAVRPLAAPFSGSFQSPVTVTQGYDAQTLRQYEIQKGRQQAVEMVSKELFSLTGFRLIRQEPFPSLLPVPRGQKGWWACKDAWGFDFCGGITRPNWNRPIFLEPRGLRKLQDYYVGPHIERSWPK